MLYMREYRTIELSFIRIHDKIRVLILVLILAANIDNVYALKMKYYALLKYHVLNFDNQIDCYESLESIKLEKYQVV